MACFPPEKLAVMKFQYRKANAKREREFNKWFQRVFGTFGWKNVFVRWIWRSMNRISSLTWIWVQNLFKIRKQPSGWISSNCYKIVNITIVNLARKISTEHNYIKQTRKSFHRSLQSWNIEIPKLFETFAFLLRVLCACAWVTTIRKQNFFGRSKLHK